MAEIVWFVRNDGVRIAAAEGSPAYGLLMSDGSFVREPGEAVTPEQPISAAEPETAAETAAEQADLTKLSKAQLVVMAKQLGLTPVPDSQTKAEIIAAIEAAQQNG